MAIFFILPVYATISLEFLVVKVFMSTFHSGIQCDLICRNKRLLLFIGLCNQKLFASKPY